MDSGHPIGKRIYYVKAQVFTLPLRVSYDRKGDLWKYWFICQTQLDRRLAVNKGTDVSIDNCFDMIGVRAQHCITVQFKDQMRPGLNPPILFTLQDIRSRAR